MKAVMKMLAGGIAITALASAAPAAAQYYPGNPYDGGGVGQVINQVLGGQYQGYGYNGYNSNTQLAVQQCAAAVEQRLSGGNGAYGYGGYAYGGNGGHDAYGNHVGGGRVLGITHADRHSRGRVKVKGVASSGMNAGYGGYGYGQQQVPDLRFECTVDYRGYISHLDIDRNNRAYGYRGY